MNRNVSGLAVAAALAAALACSKSGHAPAPAGDGSGGGGPIDHHDGGSGGTFGTGGHGSVDSGVTDASDATTDGNEHETGGSSAGGADCVADAGPAAPPSDVGSAVCSPKATWDAVTPVPSLSTGGADTFASMTFDELSVVWLTTDAGVPTIHYADRTSKADSFYPYATINPGSGYFAAERPAISADGLRIVVVRSDRKALGEFTRTGRFGTFTDAPSEGAFTSINTQGLMLVGTEYYGDPVLSADDLTLYYSRYGGGQLETIAESIRTTDDAWPIGTPLEGSQLDYRCSHRRRPTGISSDGLTLFYFDELAGMERATWRKSVTAGFSGVVDLGDRAHAQPNAACTALYYSVAGDGGLEHIVVAN